VAAIPPIISHITNPTHHIHFTVTSHRHPRPHRPTLCVRARAELIHSHGPLEPGLLTYVASLRLAYGANADPEQAAQVSGERYNSSSVSSPPPTSSSTSSTLFVGDFGSTRATGLTASFHRCFPCRVLSVLFVCPNPVLASKPLSQTPPIGSIDETYDSWGAVREATESGSLEGHDSAGNGRTDGDMAEQCVVFHSLCSSAPERMQSGWRDGADASAPPRSPQSLSAFASQGVIRLCLHILYPTPVCRRNPRRFLILTFISFFAQDIPSIPTSGSQERAIWRNLAGWYVPSRHAQIKKLTISRKSNGISTISGQTDSASSPHGHSHSQRLAASQLPPFRLLLLQRQ
jgi:hypothetical protein